MRSNFHLLLCYFAITLFFRIYAANGECCLPATLGICDNPGTFTPNFCADCTPGDPHCGVGECNADGCDCVGGCRTGICVPNSTCRHDSCDLYATNYLKIPVGYYPGHTRPKRSSSDAKTEKYQLTDEDAAAAIIQMMDRNNDGKLSPYEIYYYSARVRRLNLSNDTYDEEFKALDADHDGFVTDSEIHLPPEDKSSEKKPKPPRKSSGREVLLEAGKAGDGTLNMTEAFNYFSKNSRVQLTKPALVVEIKSLDKNNDGFLSEAELEPKNSSII